MKVKRRPSVAAATVVAVILGFVLFSIRDQDTEPTATPAPSAPPAQVGGGHADHGGHHTADAGRESSAVVRSVKSGRWSDASVWSPGHTPTPTETPRVMPGHTVTFDATSATVAGMQVDAGATLTFDPGATSVLQSSENVIVNGLLQMKPASPAIKHMLRFIDIDETKYVGGGMDPLATDVGLWVMGAGKLDLVGSPKTGWTHAAGAVAAGATSVALEAAPTGWAAGDEITITPTEPPTVGAAFYEGFDTRTVTAVSGATLTLNSGVARAHPMVNSAWKAEVANLTRNVMIEGTPGKRAHIFIHSSVPQTVNYTQIRYMGPRQPDALNDGFSKFVKGRYGLHFHMMADASRGSVVQGSVIRDTGAHAYVAHNSHGITFRDDVSFNTMADAYWWDLQADPQAPEELPTHDTLYDHCLAALVGSDEDEGYRMGGFSLGQGDHNEIRDSAAVGVDGLTDNPRNPSGGFQWPEGATGRKVWNFSRGNIAHNNPGVGIFNWQNDDQDHVLANFVAYYNGMSGIIQGAYLNDFHLMDAHLYGNLDSQLALLASSKGDVAPNPNPGKRLRAENMIMDGAGISDYGIVMFDHNAASFDPTLARNITFKNLKKGAVSIQLGEAQERYTLELVDPDFGSVNPFWYGANASAHDYTKVQIGSTAYRVNTLNSDSGTIVPAWNARQAAQSPFFTGHPDGTLPQPSFNSPVGGGKVSGVVPINAFVWDNVGATKLELYVDGALKATDTTTPFAFDWDTTALADGSAHKLQLKAYDAAGNTNRSRTETVFIGP